VLIVVDVQTVSIAIASSGVFLAAIYYILQIKHQTRIRQTDLVMRLYSTLGSKEFWEALAKFMMMEFEDYNDYKKKYVTSPTGWSEKPEFIALSQVGVFFDGIGVLLYMKLIDADLAARLFRNSARYTWEKMKPIIEGVRTEGYPQIMAEYEYLYNEVKKREQQPAAETK
jgi:hypothetical protein